MNSNLAALWLLLSPLYPGSLAPEHLADLQKSGLTDGTIQSRGIPLDLICRVRRACARSSPLISHGPPGV